MSDIWRAHYDAIYNSDYHASDAVLTLADSNAQVSLRVVEETGGITVQERQGGVAVDTIRPAVRARVYELTAAGVSLSDLNGSYIEVNGNTWRIESHISRPSPKGEAEGLVYLVLIEAPV